MLFFIGITTIIVGEVFFPSNLYEVNPCVDSLSLEENGKDLDREGTSKKEKEGFTPLLSFILFALFLSGIGKLETLGYIPKDENTLNCIFSCHDFSSYYINFSAYVSKLYNNFYGIPNKIPSIYYNYGPVLPRFYESERVFHTLHLQCVRDEGYSPTALAKLFEMLYFHVKYSYLEYRPFEIYDRFFQRSLSPNMVYPIDPSTLLSENSALDDLDIANISIVCNQVINAAETLHIFLRQIVHSCDSSLIGTAKLLFAMDEIKIPLQNLSNHEGAYSALRALIYYAIPHWNNKGYLPPVISIVVDTSDFRDLHPLYINGIYPL